MSVKTVQQEVVGQGALIPLEELAPAAVPGVAVSIEDRAKHLLITLNLMGQARSREGFDQASDESSPHYNELAQRYDGSLGNVRAGAERNRMTAESAAEWQFAYATGHFALRQSGLVDVAEANRETRRDYNSFYQKNFLDNRAEANRRRLRRQLRGQLQRNRR
jgi:hypothetical protein